MFTEFGGFGQTAEQTIAYNSLHASYLAAQKAGKPTAELSRLLTIADMGRYITVKTPITETSPTVTIEFAKGEILTVPVVFPTVTTTVTTTVAPTGLSTLIAGFDLGSNWPILAVLGIGALMIFKKGPKGKRGRKKKRSRRR
jgi:hypothetical protein